KAIFEASGGSGKELEIQPVRYGRAEILEGIHEGVRGVSEREQYEGSALVRCPRGSQAGRTPDHFQYRDRRAEGVQNELSAPEQAASGRIEGDPKAARVKRASCPALAPRNH